MDDEDARIRELKTMLSRSLAQHGIKVDAWRLESDLYVAGPLSKFWKWAQDWRSEIEELG